MYAKILVALDGSQFSQIGGEIAVQLAAKLGAEIIAAHIYDAGIHNLRFREMEPVLPKRYQDEKKLHDLRDSHNELIFEGFESLSQGYMEKFVSLAKSQGVSIKQIHKEGRNYVKLLEIAQQHHADLVIMGAHGLGEIADKQIGSTALRLLRLAECDCLVTRNRPQNGKVLVGIDGSVEALSALRKAVNWARILEKPVQMAAVYDPFFHDQVFKTMAASLSPDRQAEVGLDKQESLHEQIIDDGLGQLYKTFLDQAFEQSQNMKMSAKKHLLQGKPYRALADFAKSEKADLVVVGRFGHHREKLVPIGFNSETLVQVAETNVLVTASAGPKDEEGIKESVPIEWEKEAQNQLERIPAFARVMAKTGVERFVHAQGKTKVTLKDFLDLAARMGMPAPEEEKNE